LKTRTVWRLRRIWLPSIFGRLTALLFVFSLLILYFYIAGNRQEFSDDTLSSLIEIESWTLAICAISGLISTVSYAAVLPFQTDLKIRQIVFSGLATVSSVFLYLVVALLRAFLEPYG